MDVKITGGQQIGDKSIIVNGVNLNRIVQRVEFSMSPGSVPVVTIHCITVLGVEALLTEANVTAVIHDPAPLDHGGSLAVPIK